MRGGAPRARQKGERANRERTPSPRPPPPTQPRLPGPRRAHNATALPPTSHSTAQRAATAAFGTRASCFSRFPTVSGAHTAPHGAGAPPAARQSSAMHTTGLHTPAGRQATAAAAGGRPPAARPSRSRSCGRASTSAPCAGAPGARRAGALTPRATGSAGRRAAAAPRGGVARRRSVAAAAADGDAAASSSAPAAPGELTFVQGYTEVEALRGIRVRVEGDAPVVEFHVKWKDGGLGDTWELATNLSEDLIKAYEERWWTACRKGDVPALTEMLAGGREVLSAVVDGDRRSGLHFAAALGNLDMTRLLVEAGADVDLQDKEGYTPMHMAAGYSHTAPMGILLEAGANPEVRDKTGRDVVRLIEGLRASMPLNTNVLQRRMALEQVAGVLVDRRARAARRCCGLLFSPLSLLARCARPLRAVAPAGPTLRAFLLPAASLASPPAAPPFKPSKPSPPNPPGCTRRWCPRSCWAPGRPTPPLAAAAASSWSSTPTAAPTSGSPPPAWRRTW